MFNKSHPKSRNMLSKDKRIAIAEYILDYVKRNPGKQIPNAKIAERCDTAPHNIGSVTKQLVKMGEIKQVTRYTYVINERPTSLPPVQTALVPQPTPENIANQVEVLAKEYTWQSDAPTLRGFVKWLKDQ